MASLFLTLHIKFQNLVAAQDLQFVAPLDLVFPVPLGHAVVAHDDVVDILVVDDQVDHQHAAGIQTVGHALKRLFRVQLLRHISSAEGVEDEGVKAFLEKKKSDFVIDNLKETEVL